MDRKKYLDLCQKCATIPIKPGGLKDVTDELTVTHCGIKYWPICYQLGFEPSGKVIHSCVLHDKNANCVVTARLDKVYEFKEDII